MFDVVVNTVVMVLFGLLIGALLGLFYVLSGFLDGVLDAPRPKKKEGESFLRSIWRLGQERADESASFMSTAPRSFKIVYGVLAGFIVLLIVVLNVSPLQMNWLAFLLSVLAVSLVVVWIYRWSKAGKIQAKHRFLSFLLPKRQSPDS